MEGWILGRKVLSSHQLPRTGPAKAKRLNDADVDFQFLRHSRSSRTTFFLRCLLVSNKRWRENGSDATTGKKSYRGATCSSGWQHRRPSDNEMVTFDRSARNGYEAAVFVLLEARVQRIRRRLSSPLGSCLLRRRTGAEGARPDPEVTCFNFTRTLMSRKKKKKQGGAGT